VLISCVVDVVSKTIPFPDFLAFPETVTEESLALNNLFDEDAAKANDAHTVSTRKNIVEEYNLNLRFCEIFNLENELNKFIGGAILCEIFG